MKFDAVIIGGGYAGCTAAGILSDAGLKVCVVSEGLSLAVSGSKTPYAAQAELQKHGVTFLRGDRAMGAKIEDGRVKGLETRNLGSGTILEADFYILATGKFFSRGLLSDKEHIWEPVFGADVEYSTDRTTWYDEDFSAPQPFMGFGVKTDASAHVFVGGKALENLYASGDIVAKGCKEANVTKLIEDYARRDK